MEPQKAKHCVMIIAGEASGDLHGSRLVMAMQEHNPFLFFCGIGGQFLKEAGVRILVDAADLSVVGITEAISKASNLLKGMAVVKRILKSLRPDLLILIDFPDFNLHTAAIAKKLGIPILYYISPQIWAWRSGRIRKIQRLVDHVAVILPFEENMYKGLKIPVTFVGHPLLDHNSYTIEPGIKTTIQNTITIGLLPGSRDKEIIRHLPVMLKASNILARQIDNLKFSVSLAPSVKKELVEGIIQLHRGNIRVELVPGGVDKVFQQCGFAIVASGTVSLEASIFGIPMVIIYRVSRLSYWLGKALVRVRHIGLVNLIAGKEIVPELIQDKASPENIADTVFEMISNRHRLDRLKSRLLNIKNELGGPGASRRTADIAMGMLQAS